MASRPMTQRLVLLGILLPSLLLALFTARAAAAPEIRTHEGNRVPACVTPARLMHFMAARNPNMEPRFRDIARLYRQHGEALRVRWDYAFFQMLLETNYLIYRTGSGRWGDVKPAQNNFAGLGTTGGGVPGDSFPDVSTGVLAQLQHLVAYSGEPVANAAARRTRERQDDIIEVSRKLGRAVTFRDLTRRWAVDRRYAQSIEAIAERYRSVYCTGQAIGGLQEEHEPRNRAQVAVATQAHIRDEPRVVRVPDEARAVPDEPRDTPQSAQRDAPLNSLHVFNTAALMGAGPAHLRQPRPAERPAVCKVWTASYGGSKNILIRTSVGEEVHYTALQVLDGYEKSLADTFIRTHAQGGEPIEEFANREAALARAFDLCPSAQQPR
jgi:hypothetical protein